MSKTWIDKDGNRVVQITITNLPEEATVKTETEMVSESELPEWARLLGVSCARVKTTIDIPVI